MKNFLKIYFLFLIFSCSKNKYQTSIQGNIPNLPDGTIFLFKDNPNNKVDSTETKNGKFSLIHVWKEDEPSYIGIDHIDRNGINRFFNFTTKANYKKVPGWGTNVFLSDPVININGNLKYDTLVGINLPADKKPVTGPPLKGGKQTEAFYNIDGDLFEKIDDKTIRTVKEKIERYPYSYHLLYKINENRNSFSAYQVKDFLKSFKGEITKSETFEKLLAYNEKRFNEKSIAIPILQDKNGLKKEILNKKYKKHLIVFWASWCGPCRQEIPMLKKLYGLYENDIEFISISTDTDKALWQKALKEENMKWKQLIVSNDISENEALQIHFKLNQAIPYTVLVDNDLKILANTTGLSNEKELKKLINK